MTARESKAPPVVNVPEDGNFEAGRDAAIAHAAEVGPFTPSREQRGTITPVTPSIVQALSAVMNDLPAVGKDSTNKQQGFNFRGVDAVVNAVSPALRKHGVVVVPEVLDYDHGSVQVGNNRTTMGHVKVRVAYTFYGPDGGSITSISVGEAMDSGDKATAKAMSVAFRIALLQALCLPTTERDPDADVYDRSGEGEQDPAPKWTEEQVVAAREWISGLDAYDDDGLRAVWTEEKALLDVPVDGTTLGQAIKAAKVALDARNATPPSDPPT